MHAKANEEVKDSIKPLIMEKFLSVQRKKRRAERRKGMNRGGQFLSFGGTVWLFKREKERGYEDQRQGSGYEGGSLTTENGNRNKEKII